MTTYRWLFSFFQGTGSVRLKSYGAQVSRLLSLAMLGSLIVREQPFQLIGVRQVTCCHPLRMAIKRTWYY